MNPDHKSFGSRVLDVLRIRWNPSRDLLAVAASWILVVGSLYLATFVIGSKVLGGMGYFLTYAVLGALIFGICAPVAWTHFVRKRSLAEIGFTRKPGFARAKSSQYPSMMRVIGPPTAIG
mgnify:CR=1 FL=1